MIFAGVFNVVTGNGAFGQSLAEHPKVDKVGFTGSTEVGQILRKATAGSGKKLSLELGGKSPFVVFDSADLDTAVEGVVDAIYFNQGQVSQYCIAMFPFPIPRVSMYIGFSGNLDRHFRTILENNFRLCKQNLDRF